MVKIELKKTTIAMFKKLILLIFLSISHNCFAQINWVDSTFNIVSYFNLNEKQTFSIIHETIKLKGLDTTTYESAKYELDVWVKDSTDKSYTLVFKYKNLSTESDNQILQKLLKLNENMEIVVKTNEMGVFEEITNFEEVKQFTDSAISMLEESFKDHPKINEIISHIRSSFTSKEAIESISIKDIKQILFFNGSKYTLNENIKDKIKINNNLDGTPIDIDIETKLFALDTASNSGTLSYFQNTDSKQLTATTLKYLKKLAKEMKLPEPKKSDIKTLTSTDRLASNIHGPSGWVLYSYNTKEVTSSDITSIETIEIELK